MSTTDVLNVSVSLMALAVAVGALLLARKQVRLGKDQVELAKQQTASSARQEKLDAELAEITRRQAEIVEGQNKIFQDQLSRKAKLEVVIGQSNIVGTQRAYTLGIKNIGKKKAEGFYWSIYIPAQVLPDIGLDIQGATVKQCCSIRNLNGHQMQFCNRFETGVVFPGQTTVFAHVTITRMANNKRFDLGWALLCEDGDFPPDGAVGKLEVAMY